MMMSTSMSPLSMLFFLVSFLWTASLVAAQGFDVTIDYGQPMLPESAQAHEKANFMFGDCIPTVYKEVYDVTDGAARLPAICSQYELEWCQGNVLDQKFELQVASKPITVNEEYAKSFVCIPKP
ncbi:hypothetical protein BCR42DRAFT_428333 [Absidia repens]|uniref:Uncharacterized protein n=1 Tax=Absidia repens TaxID=90262 RepID=A0A1X2HYR4_9FUNG|nr:hypothetical protein BCR42DRAFT_428333 [Absidia repens]